MMPGGTDVTRIAIEGGQDGVIAAFAANSAQYYATYGTLPGGVSGADEGLRWFSSGVPEPWFNGVLADGAGRAPDRALVERQIAHFARLRLPFLWHCPPAVGAEYAAPRRDCGLRPFADEPVLALDLAALPAADALPDGLTIERVADAASLATWTAVWMAGVPEPTAQRCRSVYHALGPQFGEYYLGFLAGEPIATVKLFAGAGVVSVQHVKTLPAARRRGIGRALVGHALRQAREHGVAWAVLTSTPAGLPLYTRLGFNTVCRCASFLWTPADSETAR